MRLTGEGLHVFVEGVRKVILLNCYYPGPVLFKKCVRALVIKFRT